VTTEDLFLVACNFTPMPRHNYRLGVPRGGTWREVLNSDAREYWGQGYGNLGGVEAAPFPSHGHDFSVLLTLPPLGVVFLKSVKAREGEERESPEARTVEPKAALEKAAKPRTAEKPVRRRAPAGQRKALPRGDR
jgi:hypothetical protein